MADAGSIQFTITGNAKNAARELDNVANSMKRIRAASSGLTETKKQIASLSKSLKGISGLGIKGLTAPFKAGLKDLTAFASKLGGVVSGFKRILYYRMIRSLIRQITQAFAVGVRNVYDWSRAMRDAGTGDLGRFADNLDDITTSLGYFKNSIGAAAAPLIGALAPAINTVTDAIVGLLNAVNQLMARLTGQSSWTRATRQAQEYGDAVGGAGGAAKEALRYLAPFDELNVLPSNKSGGGGGGLADDIGGMFEEMVEFEDGISDFADRIRAAINAEKWDDLGKILGEKINEIVDRIDFAGLGKTVGEKINALFTTKYWTLETINFQNIGKKIAEFLNNALGSIDFYTVGASLTQKFTILGDLIISTVSNIDWGTVGASIGGYIRGAFDQISGWLDGVNWEEFGKSLVTGISDFLEKFDLASVWESVKTALVSAYNALTGFFSGVFSAINFKEFGSALVAKLGIIINDIDWGTVWENLKTSFRAAWKAIGNFFSGIFEGLEDTFDLDLKLNIKSLTPTDETGMSGDSWLGHLYPILKTIVGAAIGLHFGGVGGAILGGALALGLSMPIKAAEPTDETGINGAGWIDKIETVLAGVIPAALGFKATGSLTGALFGMTIGLGLKFGIDDIDKALKNNAGELSAKEWAEAIIAALLPTGGLILGLAMAPALGTIPGVLIGLTVGIGLSFIISHYDSPASGPTFNSGTDFWLTVLRIPEPPTLNIPVGFETMNLDEKFEAIKTQLERLGYDDILYKIPIGFDFETEYPDIAEYFEEFGNDGNYKYYVPIGLVPDEWTTPTEWVDSFVDENDVVEQPVKLGWSNGAFNSGAGSVYSDMFGVQRSNTVSYWVASHGGKELIQPVGLNTHGWNTVSSWVGSSRNMGTTGVNQGIGLAKKGWTYVSEWLKAPARSGGVVNKPVGVAKSGWSNLADWLKSSAQYGGIVSKKVTLETVMSTLAATLQTLAFVAVWNSLKDKTITLTVKLDNQAGQAINSIKGAWNTLVGAWNSTPILASKARLWYLANGGILNKTGQLFVAREDGAELVGQFGNRTGVMNNDQIVESVSRGVSKSIANVRFAVENMPGTTYADEEDNEETIYRAFVRAMTDTGYGDIDVNVNLDSDNVYKSMVRRNRANTRMTGVNAFA